MKRGSLCRGQRNSGIKEKDWEVNLEGGSHLQSYHIPGIGQLPKLPMFMYIKSNTKEDPDDYFPVNIRL